MPDVRAFMASGYFNGKIYLVGGYSTSNVDPSFGQVWVYNPATNTFNTSRASMPATLGGAGFGIINGHIYTARQSAHRGQRTWLGDDWWQAVGIRWRQSLPQFGRNAFNQKEERASSRCHEHLAGL
jgi:hypothetical protein